MGIKISCRLVLFCAFFNEMSSALADTCDRVDVDEPGDDWQHEGTYTKLSPDFSCAGKRDTYRFVNILETYYLYYHSSTDFSGWVLSDKRCDDSGIARLITQGTPEGTYQTVVNNEWTYAVPLFATCDAAVPALQMLLLGLTFLICTMN